LRKQTSGDRFLFGPRTLDDADERRTEASKVDLEKQVDMELERYSLFPAVMYMDESPLKFWRENA